MSKPCSPEHRKRADTNALRHISALLACMCALYALPLAASPLNTPAPCIPPVEHNPEAGVTYVPGADAEGWAVEQPDIDDDQPDLTLHMKLDLPLTGKINESSYQGDLSETTLPAGEVTLENNRITLDILGKGAQEAAPLPEYPRW